ncbi:MAG TPA: hypothetical protein P5556_05230 [Candidatus Gastranaerophilales bacterium]|nr:hypothetical protein [Candidatus Gastranaerophilales bacterium]
MSFGFDKEINKTNFILDIIGAKQKALSTNLANINTPGYVRQDVKFDQYLGSLDKPLETDLSKKMGSISLPEEGNDRINMTEELAEMQRNSLFYTIATRRISKVFEDLKTVSQLGR